MHVDLKTGALQPPNPDLFLTKQAAVAPDFTYKPRLWEKFLFEVTGGVAEYAAFLKRAAGYWLTGSVKEHALFVLYGSGGNGKSVFLNTLAGIFGDYAKTVASDVFTEARGDRHPTELANLAGARLVIASEISPGRRWDVERLKSLTGGDPISARYMRQDFFTFRPQFKLVIAANDIPSLGTVDPAIVRRFWLLPFTTKPERPDLGLEEKLKAEWPAILAWVVEGCLEWQEHGLAMPEAVRAATEEYLSMQDVFGAWLEDACELAPGAFAPASALFTSWQHYAEGHGERPGSARSFGGKLRKKGFQQGRDRQAGERVRGWIGLRLKPDLAGSFYP